MISLDVLLMFTVASTALAIAPGPDNIFVLSQSILYGRRAGVFVTLGLCSGLIVHISVVVLGIAAILKASFMAFTLLKGLGAAYLLYLAWQAFRAGKTGLSGSATPLSDWALYRRGILMNVSNPKVAIFFLAFFPQFTDPSLGSVTSQVIVLGAMFMATTLVVFVAIALAASQLGSLIMQSTRAQMVINRVAGTVFVLLACRLVLQDD